MRKMEVYKIKRRTNGTELKLWNFLLFENPNCFLRKSSEFKGKNIKTVSIQISYI